MVILCNIDIDFDLFQLLRCQLLFIDKCTRPYIAYNVAQLCQVKETDISKTNVEYLNSIVNFLQETIATQLRHAPLQHESLKFYVFVKNGYNTNRDKTRQLGIVIRLVDDTNTCHIIHWVSLKCQLVTRFILVGEVYAFSMGCDYVVLFNLLLKKMKIEILLFIFTDAKSILIRLLLRNNCGKSGS